MRIKMLYSALIAVILAAAVLSVSLCTFASVFTDKINAFSYNGYAIPAFDGDLYEVINGNVPRFDGGELNQNIYESYGALDSLGRVTACTANIDKTLMPTEKRGDISSVKPTGWVQKAYSFVSGRYLYNRSHLIGFQLTGENANRNNLMTGTTTFNQRGMVPFENQVAAYVKQNDENNVLYRVTPVFGGSNLLAYGVIMEAESVDDSGAAVQFCVFVYNAENGVSIDYATGNSVENGMTTDISGAYVTLSKSKYVYSGKYISPTVKVSVSGLTLSPSDYSVCYSANKNVGTASVTVSGKGAFSKSKKVYFTIVPKSTSLTKLTRAKKSVTVKWKKQTAQVTGYQLQLCTSKSFNKGVKSYYLKSKTTTKNVTRLKSKKKYFVRIRTYKKINGKKYYSKWSSIKQIKTK